MKKLLIISASVLVTSIAALVFYIEFSFRSLKTKTYSTTEFSISNEIAVADLELGKRIYHVRSGCIDCHGADLSGAKIMDNPAMGTIQGTNITPFKLANHSDVEIARAIRYGIHKENRSLRFMPSFDFEKLSKSDVAALIVYIRSVAPISKENPQNSYGPIAKVMSVFNKMPIMFPAESIDQTVGFEKKPDEAATLEFGTYLANACIGCHRPDFVGGKIPGGDPNWPEATNIRLGAKPNWTEEKFKTMILTGISLETGNPVRHPMPVHLLKQMNETEIKALWLYLSTLK